MLPSEMTDEGCELLDLLEKFSEASFSASWLIDLHKSYSSLCAACRGLMRITRLMRI